MDMAQNVLRRYPRTVVKAGKEVVQRFKYLLILDFEATCEKNKIIQPQEIIEFPCVALQTQDWQIKDVFHEFVKPRINPTLTSFCTDLTGIIQETVDNQDHFPHVYARFQTWLKEGGYMINEDSAFVTCGDWDLKVMLPNQCELDSLEVSEYFKKWIDLKKSYCEATRYYPRSLRDMLLRSNLPLEGKLHSGICDVQNMINIIKTLAIQHNAVFKINSPLHSLPNMDEKL